MLEHFEVVTHTCSIVGRSAHSVLAVAFASGAMAGGLLSAFVRQAHARWSHRSRVPPSPPPQPLMRAYRRSRRRHRLPTREFVPMRPPATTADDDALTRAYVKPEREGQPPINVRTDEDKTLTMPGVTMDDIRHELDEHRSRR